MRIIVCGSLRRKQGNSHWMINAQWLGDYTIPGYALYDLGHYPAVEAGDGAVYGEVYRIDSTTLAELDALCTKSGEYKRILIGTPYGSAWTYLYQRPVTGLTMLPGGDWVRRHEDPSDPTRRVSGQKNR